jgi:hypothetical protein
VTVGPSQTLEYQVVLTILKPEPFESGMALYLEDNGIREVTLTVRGVGVAPEGKTDDPRPKP